MLRMLVAHAMALLLVPTSAGAESLKPQIDALAQPLIDEGLVVGMVVGITNGGQTEFYAYGESARGSGLAPSADTVYEIGSISKAFTGSILAAMVAAGEVQLDDPVQRYLPESATMPVRGDQPITLERLATHTSGLPRLPDNMDPDDPDNPYADYGEEELYEFLNHHKLSRSPGKAEYSNLGMGLLGHVLARRAGTTYEQLLLARIAGPLGMTDTTITLREDQRSRLAAAYTVSLEPTKNWDIPTLAGAGGIRSTARDMIRYLEANLADDDAPLAKSLKLAHEKRRDLGDGQAIGLGWHIARDGQTRWHNGMTGGYASWASIVPEKRVGVVVLSNTATLKITELGELITRAACGEQVEPPKPRPTVAVDAATLDSYVGTYYILPWFSLTVTRDGSQLLVQASGQERFPIYAESPTKFFYKVVEAEITFVKADNGQVDKLILFQNGRELKAFRLKWK
ncbi:MAG: serine hydrolase [Planctomycetota bacterium]|nr:MAG: serine hydrolase [Planctomycetota bacterium]